MGIAHCYSHLVPKQAMLSSITALARLLFSALNPVFCWVTHLGTLQGVQSLPSCSLLGKHQQDEAPHALLNLCSLGESHGKGWKPQEGGKWRAMWAALPGRGHSEPGRAPALRPYGERKTHCCLPSPRAPSPEQVGKRKDTEEALITRKHSGNVAWIRAKMNAHTSSGCDFGASSPSQQFGFSFIKEHRGGPVWHTQLVILSEEDVYAKFIPIYSATVIRPNSVPSNIWYFLPNFIRGKKIVHFCSLESRVQTWGDS